MASGRPEAAIVEYRKALDAGDHTYWNYANLAASYALLGKMDEAKPFVAETLRVNPSFTIKWFREHVPYDIPNRVPKACARRGLRRSERDPENCGDPGRRCGRLQPARGSGRGSHALAPSGLRSDLIDPAIAAHHGRIVKRTGDGSLIEFRSVVDAVRCAIEVQNGLIERNAGVPPDRRIEFRVGIHLGDVVEESDGDLMGDGVNIAARLEGICKPGAICLSEDAYRQVKGRLDLAVTDLGPTQLKNIAEPIRVYSLEVGAPAQAKPSEPKRRLSPAPQKSCG